MRRPTIGLRKCKAQVDSESDRSDSKGLSPVKKANYAIAVAMIAGMASASAYADPLYVSNVGVPSGEYNIPTSVTNVYYAGIIEFTVNPGTSYNAGTTFTLDAFCDDLFHEVGIGSSDQYYTADANEYLAPLSLSTIHEIAGLAYEGTADYQLNGAAASAAFDADVQLAIWELEYPSDNITASDSSLQTDINGLIAQAPSFYADMIAHGYSYGELEDPGCGQEVGSITFNSCQTQGQIYVYKTGVPEPLTLSLFGASLAGAAAAFRRRRKRVNSAA